MNVLKDTHNIAKWVFDEKFYDDLKEADLLSEQEFTLEQAQSSVQNFFKNLLGGDDFFVEPTPENAKIIKKLMNDEKFINEFAQLFVISLKLYHFKKQNMLVLENVTYDKFGLNKQWSFFTKGQFCYSLIAFKENGLSERLCLPFSDVDYSFCLQEFYEHGENQKIVVEKFNSTFYSTIYKSVDKIKEKLGVNNFLIGRCFELDKNIFDFEFYLNNLLPQILQFYGLIGDREAFYTYSNNKVLDDKHRYFHDVLNGAIHTSNQYSDHQAQMISKYHKLIIVDKSLFESGYINNLKNHPDVFKNDKNYLIHLLSGLGGGKRQSSVNIELTPRFMRFLREFDPLWVFYKLYFDDLIVFLSDIQHLNQEQLPFGKNIVEQTRLLWLCWFLGCQYPKNLNLACQKIKAIKRFNSLDDDKDWWFLVRDLSDEMDYLSFCYEKLGLPYNTHQTPPKLRINTLEQVYHDSIIFHGLYAEIDEFLENNMSDDAPPLFDVMKFLGKFDNQSGIEIKPLLTQAEFSKESQLMEHCLSISGYYHACIDGEFAILHLSGHGEQSTLQLGFTHGDCKIVQHKGIKNMTPNGHHLILADSICIAFNEKLKDKDHVAQLKHGFEKHQKDIKDYHKANPTDDLSKPFKDDEWVLFFQLFTHFKSLKKLKRFLDKQKHGAI